jgi:hypothetical protein
MLINWENHIATLSPAEKERYELLRAKSATFDIPRLEANALEFEPEDFPAVLMAAAFKAEEKYRIPANEGPVPFDLYEKHLDSFKRRFKGTVKVWYPHAALHVLDIQNGRRGHFRLRPKGEWSTQSVNGNPAVPVYGTVDVI